MDACSKGEEATALMETRLTLKAAPRVNIAFTYKRFVVECKLKVIQLNKTRIYIFI